MTQGPVSLPDSGVMNEKERINLLRCASWRNGNGARAGRPPAASFGFAAFAATADSPPQKTKCLHQQS